MKNFEFLFWAYNAVWIALGVFLGYLLWRIRRAESALSRLEQRGSGR